MALRDWFFNSGRAATATVATLATHDDDKPRTVATVAGVAVASAEKKGNPGGAIEATRPLPESATGLPCGGCGSTQYTRVADGYTFPGGSLTDSWHCGGYNCGVKLLTGNKEIDRSQSKERPVLSAPLPTWCRLGCPGMEAVPLPGEGKVLGCVNPRTGAWKRLDWLQGCPADDSVPEASLPEFCRGGACKRFHKLSVPGLGVMQWCCEDTDKNHWRRERISAMTGCPKKEESEP